MRIYLFVFLIFICSCQYFTNDKQIEKSYYDNGALKWIAEYDESSVDLLCGTLFYPSGKPHKKYCLLEEVLEGDYKEFFENGVMMKSIFYKNGKKEKEAIFYHSNGEIKERVNYKNDKKEGVIFLYRKEGTLKAKDYAVNDFVHFIELFDENENSTGRIDYIPKVSILSDSIYSGDTLSVEVRIPLPKEEFKMDSIYLNLDIASKKSEDDLFVPKKIYPLEGRVMTKRFLFSDDVGEYILYGYLSKGKGYDTHRYKSFEIPFSVIKE